MSFTTRKTTQRATRFGRALLLCLFPCLLAAPALGQESPTSDVEQHLKRAADQLRALDTQAESCLDALTSDSASVAAGLAQADSCVQFMNAIDGEPVASYLADCQHARQWRDQFVNNAGSDAADSQAHNDRNLQRMIDTERYCADDSLRLRTEHVFDAFAALRQASGTQHELAGQWSGRPMPQSDSGGSVSEMHQRVRRETEQRWQQLQLELLRQQLQLPVDYGLIQ